MEQIPVRQLHDAFSNEKFSIRLVESLTQNQNLIHELHRHDFYFFLYVRRGQGKHSIDFVTYEIHEHSFFFVRPGQVHELVLESGSEGFMLQFGSGFYFPGNQVMTGLMKRVVGKDSCRLQDGQEVLVEGILNHLYAEFMRKEDYYIQAIHSYIELLFVTLVRQSLNPKNQAVKVNSYIQSRLEEFQELLEANITIKKQVSDYALLMSLTSYQLNAITKTSLKKTASVMINEQIILEAGRLLVSTTKQVSQIAEQLGYDDSSYFIRFFKKQTGLTPEAFRKNFK